MKQYYIKILSVLLFIAMFHEAKSQALLGYTPTEVRAKNPDVTWKYDKWGEDKQWMIMRYKTETYGVIYFFNENNVTIYTTIEPLTQGAMQSFVEKYNNLYVIINNKTWKFYNNDTIMLCELKINDDGNYYFKWSLEE